ncbi:hypothetical protein F442_18368 [Phytophthora nicotianae P10297]|uniref:Uncharacterized protein n=1 Tax=Phytophthora nicotianae P10297 TaxID=1317064 RepID=W2YFR8_PHYNI|nr:hypothetical protein F442_18368 [Phytophthora nicotianae P10297]
MASRHSFFVSAAWPAKHGFAMGFNAVWSLLRKDGWTAKPAMGNQIHHNYLKSGRKLKGGKQGIDFFNAEDGLLVYVRTDQELCERLHISNVMVFPLHQAVQSTFSADGRPRGKRFAHSVPTAEGNTQPKRSKTPTKKAARTPSKKPTKKQLVKPATCSSRV